MIEKHWKKLVLLLMTVALAYGVLISRYEHIKDNRYLDQWTNTIVTIPTKSERAYRKRLEQEAQQKQEEYERKIKEQWGVKPSQMDTLTARKEWYKVYNALLEARSDSLKALESRGELKMLVGYDYEVLRQNKTITPQQRIRIARAELDWWSRRIDTTWAIFKRQHPEIPSKAPTPGY